MGYFSNYTPDSNPTGLFERSVCGYPSKLETLNFHLDDLTSALETVDQNRPHNQLHPEYDRCFYSSGRYRYYEVLWAEQVSVRALLKIKELCVAIWTMPFVHLRIHLCFISSWKPGILAIMTVSDGGYRKKNRFVC